MLHWGWDKRGKGDYSGFPATMFRNEMEVGCWILIIIEEVRVHFQPTCCPRRSGPWISMRYLLRIESAAKQQLG